MRVGIRCDSRQRLEFESNHYYYCTNTRAFVISIYKRNGNILYLRFCSSADTSWILIYKTLDTGRHEIRVLSLLPGRWCDNIACELSIVSLNDKPAHEALSYTWGDPHNTIPILLNGCDFQVRVNLRNALPRLRRPETRTLWIDAICINQSDIDERSQQVSIMHDIYRGTLEAQIYLGESRVLDSISKEEQAAWSDPPHISWNRWNEDGKDQEKALTFLDMQQRTTDSDVFSNSTELLRQGDFGAFAIMCMLANAECLDDCLRGDSTSPVWVEALNSLNHMLDSPWWKRVWTFQEAMLPEKSTVIYKESLAPLHMTDDSRSVIRVLHLEGPQQCCKEFFDCHPPEQQDILIKSEKTATVQERSARSFNMCRDPQGKCLLKLLHCTREREASNARDKIFGLLGTIHHLPDHMHIVPDYSMTTSQVYTQTAIEIIRHFNDLNILMTNQIKDTKLHIPSWVPDWSLTKDNVCSDPWIEARTRRFNAGLSSIRPIAELHGGRLLTVSGIKADVVSTVTTPFFED